MEPEARELCLAAPPPNLLTLTPHFSLFLGFIFPLESIAWVNVCPALRCVFYSCREDKRGKKKRGLEKGRPKGTGKKKPAKLVEQKFTHTHTYTHLRARACAPFS